ncbi:MAG: polysaccharide deacetylase family protein [Rhodospirillaceae bacterium]|nr:polysaccharide deacetylase family protein [Rhodospirillaceae bacterium]MBT7485325.1 polysaccharide deacetylase family protein [Rhodospirillales bacterium]MBT4702418.1 polysaccharide deacetylase family protein [Rhodospirillaceae bacterium]MBT5036723.1 polysaccharide deacetylase family protein [Rhodospirillaceae bacterium]MBT6219643.1 polysaccharide deacetylase family protein [Rhodospirillaceae bacterium]
MLRYKLAGPWRMLIAFNRLLAGTRRTGFQVLLLHDVPVSQRPALERLLDYIEKTHGFLTPDAAARLIDGGAEESNRIPCLLSFDDGFVSNLDVAREILGPRRLKALFFVCPGLMDLPVSEQRDAIAKNIFQGRVSADELDDTQRLMTWQDLEELQRMGHTIGSHGMTHKRLSDLTGDALKMEILGAGLAVEEKLAEPCPWYAYAFGDIGSVSIEAFRIIMAAHRYCRTGIRGLNFPGTPEGGVLAQEIGLDTPFTYQKLVLDGGLDIRYGRSCIKLFQMLGHASSSTEQHSIS